MNIYLNGFTYTFIEVSGAFTFPELNFYANQTLKTRSAKYMTGGKCVQICRHSSKSKENNIPRNKLHCQHWTREKPVDVKRGDFTVPIPDHAVTKKTKFVVGDHVRISMKRKVFDKGYDQGWTREVFVISKIIYGNPITYNLVDTEGEKIEGAFYTRELNRCAYSENQLFKVEKVLETRIHKGKEQSKVKWLGYPMSAASWVDSSSLINL